MRSIFWAINISKHYTTTLKILKSRTLLGTYTVPTSACEFCCCCCFSGVLGPGFWGGRREYGGDWPEKAWCCILIDKRQIKHTTYEREAEKKDHCSWNDRSSGLLRDDDKEYIEWKTDTESAKDNFNSIVYNLFQILRETIDALYLSIPSCNKPGTSDRVD